MVILVNREKKIQLSYMKITLHTSIKQNFDSSNSYGIETANMALVNRYIRDLKIPKAARNDRFQ